MKLRFVIVFGLLVAGGGVLGCGGKMEVGSGTTSEISSCSDRDGTECAGGSCCASPLVTGGTFEQGLGTGSELTAEIADFRLDQYEVTVSRFRAFVKAYDRWRGTGGKPSAGDGANPHVSGSGWSDEFTLPADAQALEAALACDPAASTWSTSENQTLPINCVDWFTAFAFCIWDGGRLPTESEWEYAAVGGSNDWQYPWGNAPVPNDTPATASLAVYGCLGDGQDEGCSAAAILSVGSKPAGRGLYGQEDLAGSMWEWVLDWYGEYPTTLPDDYANVRGDSFRVVRGGGWSNPAANLRGSLRGSEAPTDAFDNFGFRCARSP